MRERGLTRFVLYAAMGAAGTAAHYALLVTAVSMGMMAPVQASVAGALVGAVVNFVLNAAVTFRGRDSHFALGTATRFFATAGVAALVNGAAMAVLVEGLRIDYRLAQLMVTAALLCATYLVNAMWTFRASKAR
jgi:putative flippase GtrA